MVGCWLSIFLFQFLTAAYGSEASDLSGYWVPAYRKFEVTTFEPIDKSNASPEQLEFYDSMRKACEPSAEMAGEGNRAWRCVITCTVDKSDTFHENWDLCSVIEYHHWNTVTTFRHDLVTKSFLTSRDPLLEILTEHGYTQSQFNFKGAFDGNKLNGVENWNGSASESCAEPDNFEFPLDATLSDDLTLEFVYDFGTNRPHLFSERTCTWIEYESTTTRVLVGMQPLLAVNEIKVLRELGTGAATRLVELIDSITFDQRFLIEVSFIVAPTIPVTILLDTGHDSRRVELSRTPDSELVYRSLPLQVTEPRDAMDAPTVGVLRAQEGDKLVARIGNTPAEWNVQHDLTRFTAIVRRVFPPPSVTCNTFAGAISGYAGEDLVSCDGYDFRRLYVRARENAERRATTLSCDPGCSSRRSWEIARSARCSDDGETVPAASVRTMFATGCFDSDDPLLIPVALSEPRADDFLDPDALNENETDFDPPENWDPSEVWTSDGDAAAEPVGCVQPRRMLLTYQERVLLCPPDSYEPIIGRAEKIARTKWSEISCDEACSMRPYESLSTNTSCLADLGGEAVPDPNGLEATREMAVIDIRFNAECE